MKCCLTLFQKFEVEKESILTGWTVKNQFMMPGIYFLLIKNHYGIPVKQIVKPIILLLPM